MKITVISHAYQNERYLKVLEAMGKIDDVEITLIHPSRYKHETFKWSEPHTIKQIPVRVFFGSRQGAFLYSPADLARALDQCTPEIILHEQEVYALSAAQISACARRRVIPLVQFVWENIDRKLCLPRRLLRRYVLSCSAALIAGSHRAKSIHRGWGFKGPTDVMPQMGINAALVPSLGRRGAQDLKICFVGRLESCKGVDCLLHAIALLHRRGFQVQCGIAGEGPERRPLARLAHELGIWTMVHFCGYLPEARVQHLLRTCDALVLPSRRTKHWQEQFGLVLAEAMAHATIAVGSKTGAIPEVIGLEELLFAENDVDGLTEILARLAIDSGFYQRSQLVLWERAREQFEAPKIASRKISFLARVLAKQEAPARETVPLSTTLEAGSR